ncbi:MAG: class I SAM-dependent methyltransferase [Caldilinea sp. CFX5]|nr:class I SAM-dependent methyltransferase [Caldilinea sp. CFX5]
MDLQELQAELADYLTDDALLADSNLLRRAEALDFITFLHDVLRMERRRTPAVQTLHQQATQLQTQLTAVNTRLFQQVRMGVQSGALTGAALRRYLNQFTDYTSNHSDRVYMSYDGLDVLVDGLFQLKSAPAATLATTVEMVHCEETPARVLLDLVDHTPLMPTDVFYDLGAGLGQVALLIHLLTGVRAKGVEIEPAFCTFAQQQARTLGVTDVTFINSDARTADYSDGTVFFMFTPFRGQLLQSVLARLQQEAQQRPIRLCTFGSCTPHVADQPWLRPIMPDARHEYKLVIFESR